VSRTRRIWPQRVDLVVVEAGGRLVEEQKLGVAGERAGELDALAHREGQAPGRPKSECREVHERHQLLGALRDAPLLGLRPRQAQGVGDEAGRGAAVAADLDVVEHAHAVEQGDVLEGAADAELGDDMARPVEDGAALEQDVTLVGHVEPGEAVEKGGLAGAVGADQPGDAAGRHVEGDAIEGDDAAEAHRHIAYAQQRAGGAGLGRGAHLRLRNHGRTPAPLRSCLQRIAAPGHVGLSDRLGQRILEGLGGAVQWDF
jgi:hypothetical protein